MDNEFKLAMLVNEESTGHIEFEQKENSSKIQITIDNDDKIAEIKLDYKKLWDLWKRTFNLEGK